MITIHTMIVNAKTRSSAGPGRKYIYIYIYMHPRYYLRQYRRSLKKSSPAESTTVVLFVFTG